MPNKLFQLVSSIKEVHPIGLLNGTLGGVGFRLVVALNVFLEVFKSFLLGCAFPGKAYSSQWQ